MIYYKYIPRDHFKVDNQLPTMYTGQCTSPINKVWPVLVVSVVSDI